MFGSGILGSGLIRVKLRRVRIGSVLKRVGYGSGMGCPFSVHYGSGHYGSGMTWVGSFRVWVISGVAQFRVSFGYGSVYIGCSGPNRFSPFRVSVRVSGFGSVLPGLIRTATGVTGNQWLRYFHRRG